jgi:hypothetical protein
MMKIDNSKSGKILNPVAAVEYAERSCYRTNTKDPPIVYDYIGLERYWAEAVYQWHKQSALASMLPHSIIEDRCGIYWTSY